MCGISGFSLREDSTVNARELAHALLTEIEWRGTHASGYAYQNAEGHIGYYKNHVRGSQLPLKTLPRSAQTARNVILHTRFATQGDIYDNTNNHPVINPSGNVALVHNGVIWNDSSVRHTYLRDQVGQLADVDSAVIGAMLEEYGFDGWKNLAGDAAVAWLTQDHDGLGLARIEGNPIAYTWLLDGSFVFASTVQLLSRALDAVGLEYGALFLMDEAEAFDIRNGVIMAQADIPRDHGYGFVTPTWRAATSGGHGSEDDDTPTGASFANHYDEESDTWSYDPDERDEAIAMAMLTTLNADKKAEDIPETTDEYYTVDHDGDFKSYKTLEDLETELKWVAGLHDTDNHYGAEGNARWVEQFVDVGTIDAKTGGLVSFVDNVDELNWVEDFDHVSLDYIRDGISYLTR